MKRIWFVITLILITASCKQNETVFSCDPVLNKYISTHVRQLKSLSLNDLVSSNLAYQQAVFRSYDALKKRETWMQRIQLLLDTQGYTEAEYAHVSSLLSHLDENFFVTERLESEVNERRKFSSDWISTAKNTLGWSDKDVAFVVYRLYTDKAQFDSEIATLRPSSATVIDPNGNCTCSTSSSFCADLMCVSGGCQLTTGCGWLWSETCDGTCR